MRNLKSALVLATLPFVGLGLLPACADTDTLGVGGTGALAAEGGSTASGTRPPEGGSGGTGTIAGTGGTGGGATCVTTEVCGDGVDNDCNGQIDDGCECAPGETRSCFSGDPMIEGVGQCAPGTQTCDDLGKWGVDCAGEVLPESEICDGVDNDCDNQVDQGFETVTCGQGACQVTVNECQNGMPQTCTPLDPPSVVEQCDGIDDNCNGSVDEGCTCVNGQTQACYSGAMGTAGVGPCKAGTQTCVGGQWGNCTGEVVPQTEACDNIDQDCDGNVAEGACNLPNASSSCMSGGCVIGSCTPGHSNCDPNSANGCEVDHTGHSNNLPGEDLGDFNADAFYGFGCSSGGSCEGPILTRTGTNGRYFHIDALEASSCCAFTGMRVQLTVPPGSDYDLYLSGNGCFADPDWQSLNGTGANETITVWCDDDCGGADNSFGIDIEVRYFSGASCDPWTLSVFRRDC